jgi:methionyl-tRNA formyltransferase
MGCINLHASLLPKYRGAAPIQWALINGEKATGVTVFLIEPAVDTGAIIRQREVAVGPDETYGELAARLSRIGAEEVVGALQELATGTARYLSQDESRATRAPKLTKNDGLLDWSGSSEEVRNRVRGVTPSPGAFTQWRGAPLVIWRVEHAADPPDGVPGEVVIADPRRGVAVRTADGALWLTTVQPAGKRAMGGAAWVRGARLQIGERFGGP